MFRHSEESYPQPTENERVTDQSSFWTLRQDRESFAIGRKNKKNWREEGNRQII